VLRPAIGERQPGASCRAVQPRRGGAVVGLGRGRAEQVDPMKPMLIAPGTKRLKLKHDVPPSNFAIKLNLRRYSVGQHDDARGGWRGVEVDADSGLVAGAYTRPLLSST